MAEPNSPESGAAEITATVGALAISYVFRVRGAEGLAAIFERVGAMEAGNMINHPDERISYARVMAAVDTASAVCRDTDIGYRLGEEGARVLHEQGRLHPFRGREFAQTLQVMTEVLASGNSIRDLRARVTGDGSAELESDSLAYEDDPFLCRFIVGFLTDLPAYIGRSGAIIETQCITEGADRCRFSLNWRPAPPQGTIVAGNDSAPISVRLDEIYASPASNDDSADVESILRAVVDGLKLPPHALGLHASLTLEDGDEYEHTRGHLDGAKSTVFSASIVGVPGLSGTTMIAFAGRGLPTVDRFLVESCAQQIGAVVSGASNFSELRARAMQDPLTGLANRSQLEERAATMGDGAAVVFLDLDEFKAINDGHGHIVGDALLAQIGQRLKHALRASDLVARYGGDEFVALAVGTRSIDDANVVAAKLLATFAQPFELDGDLIALTGSCGVARVPDDGETFNDLVAIADARMYETKQRSR